MRDLMKWQIVSFMSRGVAMGLGIIQSIFVARILTVSEYGLIGIVTSIGAIFGVTQHLGLASGSTREISAAKDNKEVFKIFSTAVLIRYFVTVPLAIILLVSSKYLALTHYAQPEILMPLRLYALVLLVQAVQSMLNSVISGTHRFKQLFIYQAAIAVVSLVIYLPLIYFYRVEGYFYALIAFNLIGSLTLGVIALAPLKKDLEFPNRSELVYFFKELFTISMGIYAVKLIYTFWQRLGPILLGAAVSAEQVGIFSFALLYTSKIMAVSDAVTDVNLPVLSKKFVSDFEEFKSLFKSNFDKIFVFVIISSTTAVFWGPQIFHIAIGGPKYDASLFLLPPLIIAFILYAFVNIIKSSILLPARLIKQMVIGYILMIAFTFVGYIALQNSFSLLNAMSYAMAGGVSLGFLLMVVLSQYRLEFSYFSLKHLLVLLLGLVITYSWDISDLFLKISVYLGYLAIFTASVFLLRLISKNDIIQITSKFFGKKNA